jgi:hypothetical protein
MTRRSGLLAALGALTIALSARRARADEHWSTTSEGSRGTRGFSEVVDQRAKRVTGAEGRSARSRRRPQWAPGHRTTSEVEPQVSDQSLGSSSGGAYGRFDGDLDLGLGLGTELERGVVRGAARLTLHYYSMVGVYATYRDAFDAGAERATRVVSFGVDLRPGFVPRWAKNLEQGPSTVDLFVDSLSLGLGAFWSEPPHADFGDQRGFETSLGFGLPLFGRAHGLWLEARGALRWADVPTGNAVPSALVLLSWHSFLLSPIARAEASE